jgi:pyruvate ferredoxin oxidoreductase gamma subunit
MLEIRIHGRGGQGNVVAAYLLATAAIDEGKFGQAFPAFGAERRGAPVVSFVRIAEQALRRHNQVLHPAYLIIQDQALLHVPGVLDGLRTGGGILVNSTIDSDTLSARIGQPLVTLPADSLSSEYLGKPLPNTALLAAFLSLTGILPMESLVKALAHRFSGSLLENNVRLIQDIAHRVPADLWKESAHAPGT